MEQNFEEVFRDGSDLLKIMSSLSNTFPEDFGYSHYSCIEEFLLEAPTEKKALLLEWITTKISNSKPIGVYLTVLFKESFDLEKFSYNPFLYFSSLEHGQRTDFLNRVSKYDWSCLDKVMYDGKNLCAYLYHVTKGSKSVPKIQKRGSERKKPDKVVSIRIHSPSFVHPSVEVQQSSVTVQGISQSTPSDSAPIDYNQPRSAPKQGRIIVNDSLSNSSFSTTKHIRSCQK